MHPNAQWLHSDAADTTRQSLVGTYIDCIHRSQLRSLPLFLFFSLVATSVAIPTSSTLLVICTSLHPASAHRIPFTAVRTAYTALHHIAYSPPRRDYAIGSYHLSLRVPTAKHRHLTSPDHLAKARPASSFSSHFSSRLTRSLHALTSPVARSNVSIYHTRHCITNRQKLHRSQSELHARICCRKPAFSNGFPLQSIALPLRHTFPLAASIIRAVTFELLPCAIRPRTAVHASLLLACSSIPRPCLRKF